MTEYDVKNKECNLKCSSADIMECISDMECSSDDIKCCSNEYINFNNLLAISRQNIRITCSVINMKWRFFFVFGINIILTHGRKVKHFG